VAAASCWGSEERPWLQTSYKASSVHLYHGTLGAWAQMEESTCTVSLQKWSPDWRLEWWHSSLTGMGVLAITWPLCTVPSKLDCACQRPKIGLSLENTKKLAKCNMSAPGPERSTTQHMQHPNSTSAE
jgi:hypothetical protein